MPGQWRHCAGAVTLALATALVAGGVAAIAPAAGAARMPVPQGLAAAVTQNAPVFGNTPPNTPVTVSIVLRMQNENQLMQSVQSGFRGPYLTVSQFAQRYGQPQAVIQLITAYLAHYGIQSTVYPDHLDITANGTAGEFDQAFDINLEQMGPPGNHGRGGPGGPPMFHGTNQNPTVPAALANVITAVLGLTNYSPYVSNAVQAVEPANQPAPSAGASGIPAGMATPANFAQHYDVTPLYSQGDEGQGQTVGIITLASMNPSDAYTFWSMLGLSTPPNRIDLVNVDGGAGAPSLSTGSDETVLDVEQSGALAPDANIVVYQAPNTDYGFVDAFFQAVCDDTAGALSTSWGESETAIEYTIANGEESPGYTAAFDEALIEAAAQGQSAFAATGDFGAYQAFADLGTTNLAVGYPGSSPFVTAAGGTTWAGTQNYGPFSINVPAERTWGWDYLWPYWQQFGFPSETAMAESFVIGSNGGFSTIYPTPAYQQGVSGIGSYQAVPYLTPTNNDQGFAFNPTPSVISGQNTGRETPDVSANGDPQTGYAVYSPLFGGSGFAQYGGTSFVAPQLAGVTALIDAHLGRRVGFWNPQIYAFATRPGSPFTPIDTAGTQSDNLYYTGTAGTLYNPGSGLGYPDVARLAGEFGQVPGPSRP